MQKGSLLPNMITSTKLHAAMFADGTHIFAVYRELLYPEWVHVAVVACGDRQPETCVAVKAIMSTAAPNVFIHIFTEDNLMESFHKEVCI